MALSYFCFRQGLPQTLVVPNPPAPYSIDPHYYRPVLSEDSFPSPTGFDKAIRSIVCTQVTLNG